MNTRKFWKGLVICIVVSLVVVGIVKLVVRYDKELSLSWVNQVYGNKVRDSYVHLWQGSADLAGARTSLECLERWLEGSKDRIIELEGQEGYDARMKKVQDFKARIEELHHQTEVLTKELEEAQKSD